MPTPHLRSSPPNISPIRVHAHVSLPGNRSLPPWVSRFIHRQEGVIPMTPQATIACRLTLPGYYISWEGGGACLPIMRGPGHLSSRDMTDCHCVPPACISRRGLCPRLNSKRGHTTPHLSSRRGVHQRLCRGLLQAAVRLLPVERQEWVIPPLPQEPPPTAVRLLFALLGGGVCPRFHIKIATFSHVPPEALSTTASLSLFHLGSHPCLNFRMS